MPLLAQIFQNYNQPGFLQSVDFIVKGSRQFYYSMRPNQAEEVILWERVQQNMQLVGKINKDLQNTAASKSFESCFTNNHSLEPIKDIKITRKMLDAGFKDEELKSQIIHNKLAYMRLNQLKQQKALELAKKKFVRIANIRKQSLKEREKLNQIRQSLHFQEEEAIQIQARDVKSSRKTRKDAIEKWQRSLQQTAEGVREQKFKFHTICLQEKKEQMETNTKKADRVRKSLQKSRLSIEQSNWMRMQTSKQRHRRDLQSRYKQLSKQKKTNEKLYDVLKSQTERLNEWQNRKRKQVEQFKSIWIKCRENPECVNVDLDKSRISLS